MSILLISPPFVQLNSPYSALPFLIGSLKANGIDCSGYDLGIKIAGKLFSKSGLELLYDTVRTCGKFKSDDIDFFMAYKNDYIKTIGHVVSFLKGKNPNLAIKIINPDYLPVWKMSQTAFECNIDQFGTTDYARYLASLYLEDIFLFYKAVCPDYELSRYGEKLAVSPPFFDKLYKSVIDNNDIISGMIADELIHSEFTDHEIIALTVPFPGTLLGAL
ncbi:MAG: hypothetical protein KKD38_10660, partial [Candidatus Delongbacteria bacterium]|nr:hypothetical protein [Candidatus Delongbacteria bacterium]